MKRIVILGSTGSIGHQTLDIIRSFPHAFDVVGLAAWTNQDLLLEQAKEFQPRFIFSKTKPNGTLVPPGCQFISDLAEMVANPDVDLVVQGMVGNAGLFPTLAAIRAGKQIALANKEPIVMAGELLTREAAKSGAQLLPVDSEPSAIWQCLRGEEPHKSVKRILITASGGPFRTRSLESISSVTPKEALAHPTWSMGKKITIDSATLMNKGFEVIESHWLFSMPWEQIDVVVHPQSIIHSMVEFRDGSIKAQLGLPDMRLPIQYALFYPERLENSALPRFDPLKFNALTFEPIDPGRYPCFVTALAAGKSGGVYPAVLSAADEAAVYLFLDGVIPFSEINGLVSNALDRCTPIQNPTLEDIVSADGWARDFVESSVGKL